MESITDRIREVMNAEGYTSARFADDLEVGRAVISHILNGRNNPSLDIITKILSKLPQISTEWLLNGTGEMYKTTSQNNVETDAEQIQHSQTLPDLFAEQYTPTENKVADQPSHISKNVDNVTAQSEKENLNEIKMTENAVKEIVNERIIYRETPVKKIKQIIIYYSDNTFETFISE